MSKLLETFLSHYDPLSMGFSRRGIAYGGDLGTGLFGWAVPGAQGREAVAAVAMFRGEGRASAIDYSNPVGLALGKATAVKNFAFRGHDADTWYVYAARAVNGAGVLSPLSHHPMRLLTDDSGDIVNPPVPNPPAQISAIALPSGKAEVVTRYAAQGHGVFPTDLRIFGKSVSDPHSPDTTGLYAAALVDDVTGLTEIAYTPGKSRYVFRVQSQTDGEYWVFGAQFRNAAGVAATNTLLSNVIRIKNSEPAKTDGFTIAIA